MGPFLDRSARESRFWPISRERERESVSDEAPKGHRSLYGLWLYRERPLSDCARQLYRGGGHVAAEELFEHGRVRFVDHFLAPRTHRQRRGLFPYRRIYLQVSRSIFPFNELHPLSRSKARDAIQRLAFRWRVATLSFETPHARVKHQRVWPEKNVFSQKERERERRALFDETRRGRTGATGDCASTCDTRTVQSIQGSMD